MRRKIPSGKAKIPFFVASGFQQFNVGLIFVRKRDKQKELGKPQSPHLMLKRDGNKDFNWRGKAGQAGTKRNTVNNLVPRVSPLGTRLYSQLPLLRTLSGPRVSALNM